MSYLTTAKGVQAHNESAAIVVYVEALTQVRDRVEGWKREREETIDKLLALKLKRYAKQYAYHVRVLAKLTVQVQALNWAIEKAHKGD